jgi:hypothetical protein
LRSEGYEGIGLKIVAPHLIQLLPEYAKAVLIRIGQFLFYIEAQGVHLQVTVDYRIIKV